MSLSGDPFRLSNLKGMVVVLDFWGTWCGPCSEEMASLERLRSSLSGKAVQIWSVTEDKPDAAERLMLARRSTLDMRSVRRRGSVSKSALSEESGDSSGVSRGRSEPTQDRKWIRGTAAGAARILSEHKITETGENL